MTPPASILVVITRRIGDVLLATPLIRSIKQAWPNTQIDALVFRGTEGVLSANTDLRQVHTIAERPTWAEHWGLLRRMLRRYDIALSLLQGDRPTLYAWLAGRRRYGRLDPGPKSQWKRRLLTGFVEPDADQHTVRAYLSLTEPLGLPAQGHVVVSWESGEESAAALAGLNAESYVVLHPYPKYHYKMWHQAGWVELGEWLRDRGFKVVLTGGPDAQEVEYVSTLAMRIGEGALNLAGRLSLGQTGCLLASTRLFIGPDTSVTHMAAAVGVPTVALFGPSDPVKWGPWPARFPPDRNPWVRQGSQQVGNVQLLQGTDPRRCVPCLLEGCNRSEQSYSECLQKLTTAQVIQAVEHLLAKDLESQRP